MSIEITSNLNPILENMCFHWLNTWVWLSSTMSTFSRWFGPYIRVLYSSSLGHQVSFLLRYAGLSIGNAIKWRRIPITAKIIGNPNIHYQQLDVLRFASSAYGVNKWPIIYELNTPTTVAIWGITPTELYIYQGVISFINFAQTERKPPMEIPFMNHPIIRK